MCTTHNGNKWDRAANTKDADEIELFYSNTLPDKIVQKIYNAMTLNSYIKPIALVFVCELVKGKILNLGIPNFGYFLPFSAMSLDGGYIRYQTPTIIEVHNAWASFSMGQKPKEELITLLRKYSIEIMEVHDCGCISTDPTMTNTKRFKDNYNNVNLFRSYPESAGFPVITTNIIEHLSTDMTKEAIESYARIEEYIQTLTSNTTSVVPDKVFHAKQSVKDLFQTKVVA